MNQAEKVIFAVVPAALGRAVSAGAVAIGPGARRVLVAQQPVFVRLDANAIEYLRLKFHHDEYMGIQYPCDKDGDGLDIPAGDIYKPIHRIHTRRPR